MSEPEIFLSYNREDYARAKLFADAFAAEGFSVWWDARLKSGEAYDKVTETALHGAKAVVVLWSIRSVESRWVRAEATVGDRNGTLAPAMIEPCRRPVMFELTQTAELSHWRGNRKDPAWRAFVEDVRDFIGNEKDAVPAENYLPPRDGIGAGLRRWRYPLLAAVAALVLLAAGAWLWLGAGAATAANAPLRIAVFDAQGGPEATQFAQTLEDTIVDVMNQAGVPIITDLGGTPAASANRAGQVLKGTVTQAQDGLKVFAQIVDASSGISLWSDQFEGKASEADRLSTSIAVAAAEPFATMGEINAQKGVDVSPSDMALQIKSMSIIDSPQPFQEGMARRVSEEAVARSPDLAYAHSMLALTLVHDGARAPPQQRAALFERARSEADTAIRIAPDQGDGAYDARYVMSVYSEPGNIIGQEDLLLDGLRNAPEAAFLNMRECEFLLGVGMIEDAWPYCQRARAIRPLSAPIVWRFAVALNMRGEQALAEQAIDQAVRYYPDNGLIRLAKFEILGFGGSHERAMELLPAMLNQSESFGTTEIEALKLYLDARRSRSAGDKAKASAAISAAATGGKLRLDLAVKALVALGNVDQAFRLLEPVDKNLPPQMDQAPANSGILFLFAPETAPLRSDPRFWPVAVRLGLVDYWKKRNEWPDFCGKEVTLKNCQAQAGTVGSTPALGR